MIKFNELPKFISTPIFDTESNSWKIINSVLYRPDKVKIVFTDTNSIEIEVTSYFDLNLETTFMDKANIFSTDKPIEENPNDNPPNEDNQTPSDNENPSEEDNQNSSEQNPTQGDEQPTGEEDNPNKDNNESNYNNLY